ncbi:MAG: hypothetical protein DI563_01360 [Variovorax paradoxus]|uniref:Phthalate dioxygenase reductase n=1 Tax=Variovorax paradoxus TaxID=34073 RepID=A0A2W5QLI8_VARPD|nr:MAG: hypothetical protein DI563_01360 [Variovorax paradoxus]
MCNAPAEQHRYLIAVMKDPASRGGSRAMHEQVREGDVLTVSRPKNHFELARDGRASLLVAAGIGVTPILCMAERLAPIGEPFEMHYCTRSMERTAFRKRIGRSPFADRVSFHFDDGPTEQKLDIAALLAVPLEGVHLYVCGPQVFMDAVLTRARASGWAEAQLHYEFFATRRTNAEADESFEVVLSSSGRVVSVLKEMTVVQALERAGVQVLVSCEQGVCRWHFGGSSRTRRRGKTRLHSAGRDTALR